MQAIAKAQNHQSYVVTTGTGSGGWRQLPWQVDDNYPGWLKADAGQVREAGLA
jgi:hypothetical protein